MDTENFGHAAWFNFSGRCTPRRLSAAGLVEELDDGFATAVEFMARLHAACLERYHLKPYPDQLLAEATDAMPNAERLCLIEPHRLMMHPERALAGGAGAYFRSWRLAQRCLISQP
jgi:hypothetical protein